MPGVTRRSVIELARQRGYTVEEGNVSIHEALEADEIFTTGTAVVLTPVGSLTYKGDRKQYGELDKPGTCAGVCGLSVHTASFGTHCLPTVHGMQAV